MSTTNPPAPDGFIPNEEKWPLRMQHRKSEEKYRGTHRVERKESNKVYVRSLKEKVISHYSNDTMACAGLEDDLGCRFHVNLTFFPLEVLLAVETIDHLNNDGGKHRKELFGKRGYAGYHFYQWLIKNNFPSGYQVLCFNCQWIKRFNDLNTKVKSSVN